MKKQSLQIFIVLLLLVCNINVSLTFAEKHANNYLLRNLRSLGDSCNSDVYQLMHNPTVQTADAKVVGYAKAIGTPTGYKCIVFNASKCDIVVNGAERPGKCCEESFDWSNSAQLGVKAYEEACAKVTPGKIGWMSEKLVMNITGLGLAQHDFHYAVPRYIPSSCTEKDKENYAETVAQQIVDDDPLAIACTMGWDEGAPPS